ncbi:hypothetical protein FJ364_00795 [Candidatus Dependentiae bacterium]|nr:hypothetical protein [Candidatus Dependentiae bacterium]
MKYRELESSTVEWKLTIPENEQIIKTIVGFCNLNGGKLVIGVANDGTVVGVSDDKIQTTLEYLNLAIYQATHPTIIPHIYTQNIHGKTLLVIEVSAGMNKPYFIKSSGLEHGTFLRIGRSTIRATADMIDELQWTSRGKSFDKMPVYQATQKDLDVAKIEQFMKKREQRKGSITKKEALYAYHCIVEEHEHTYPTTAGILLFGKHPQHFFPEARVMCAHFPGGIVEANTLATKECIGTLPEQFDEAFNFVLSRLNYTWKLKGTRREETLEIPKDAIREILINALVHRNYHIQAPTKIAIFNNRLEIFSPGNFPGPLNQQNLRCGFTFLRNVAICASFRELGLVETFGIGFQKLFSSYEAMNLQPPQVIEDANYVKCIMPRGISTTTSKKPQKITYNANLQGVMDLFTVASEITIADVMHATNTSRSTAGRRLAELIKHNLIEKIGEGKGARYKRRRDG